MNAADAAPPAPRISAAETLIVLLAGIVAGVLGIGGRLVPFDEPNIFLGGERLLRGDLPYRDYYALYPPGQYFVVAAVLGLFGLRIVVLRLYCVVVHALIALLLHRIARTLAGRAAAAVAWTAAMLWMFNVRAYGYPVMPAMLLVLGAQALLTHASTDAGPDAPRWKSRLFAAGAMTSAAAFFRHDVAFYGLVASAPGLWRLAQIGADASGGPRRIVPWAAGLVVAFVPPAVWLVASVPVRELVFELFTYPSGAYAAMRGGSFPPPVGVPLSLETLAHPRVLAGGVHMEFYVPIALHLLAVGVVALDVRRRGRAALLDRGNSVLCGAALFGALLLTVASVRPGRPHITPSVIVSYAVAAALAARALRGGRSTARRLAAAAVAGASALTLLPALTDFRRPDVAKIAGMFAGAPSEMDRRASNLATDPDERAVAEYVLSVVPPGGRLFVGCGRHDKVFINEPIVYLMTGLAPGTKYHAFDPGVATLPDVQRDITADLDRHRVEYLVLSTRYDERRERNASAVADGPTILDEYIRANYAVCFTSGPSHSVWRRTTPFAYWVSR